MKYVLECISYEFYKSHGRGRLGRVLRLQLYLCTEYGNVNQMAFFNIYGSKILIAEQLIITCLFTHVRSSTDG